MSEEKRPEWMESISAIVNPDDYLLGRKIDKTFELSQQEKAQQAREARAELIANNKIILAGDPILELHRKKEQLKWEIINNPVKLRQLREKLLREERGQKSSSGEKLSSFSVHKREYKAKRSPRLGRHEETRDESTREVNHLSPRSISQRGATYSSSKDGLSRRSHHSLTQSDNRRSDRSTRRHEKSPKRSERSPRRHEKSPKRSERSPRRHEKSPKGSERSSKRSDESHRRRDKYN